MRGAEIARQKIREVKYIDNTLHSHRSFFWKRSINGDRIHRVSGFDATVVPRFQYIPTAFRAMLPDP
jgi:hypothetical protein